MKSLLHTLNDNDSVLLMYLFDELPADDRAEVEAMLSTDAGLRSELDQLVSMHASVSGTIAKADAATRTRGPAITKQAFRAIDQWGTRRLLAQPAAPLRRRSNLRWAMYGTAVAAAILIASAYFWVMTSDLTPAPQLAGAQPAWEDRAGAITDSFENQTNADASTDVAVADTGLIDSSDLLRKSLDPSEEIMNDTIKHVDLNAAEKEISTVAQLSDHDAIADGLNFQ